MGRTAVLLTTGALAVLLASVAALTVVAAVPKEAQAAFLGQNGRIAFALHNQDGYDIYTMKPGGTDIEQVTDEPGSEDTDPAVSPDGTKIAFQSDRDGDREIYVKDLKSGELSQLTNNGTNPNNPKFPITDKDPAWSPDGTRVVFSSNRATTFEDYRECLYIMSADGSDQHVIPYACSGNTVGDAAWSPSGKKIAYAVGNEGTYDIWVINSDGSNAQNLSNDGLLDETGPNWGPYGKRIVFAKNYVVDGPTDIWKMKPDGSNKQQLTRTKEVSESSPAFSPNGRRIVFTRGFAPFGYVFQGDLIKMNSDGTNKTNISATSGYEGGFPDWGPRPATSP